MLNYTTSVHHSKTLGEINTLLARARCQSIMTEFDKDARPASISFRITTPDGLMSYRLPAHPERVLACMRRNAKIGPRYCNHEHAINVAWRILKDWLSAQMAIIESSMVTLDQVFLPYAQNHQGVTLYESLKETRFQGLALPAPTPA